MYERVSYDYLTQEALDFLAINAVVIGRQVVKNEMENGEAFIMDEKPIYEIQDVKQVEMEDWPHSKATLHSYVMKNGAVVKEVIQAWATESEYKSTAFLALQTANGNLIGLWPEYHFDPDDIILREK